MGCELWSANDRTCYAGKLHRLRRTHMGFVPQFETPKLVPGGLEQAAGWSDLTGTDRSEKPWLSGLPRLIFVSEIGDARSDSGFIATESLPVGQAYIRSFLKPEILDIVKSGRGRRHQWLWLSKRPQRMGRLIREHCPLTDPLPLNLWFGTSVSTRASLRRVAQLAAVGGENVIRFVSAAPLREPVSLADFLGDVHWVIVGGEWGLGRVARRFECDWARRLIGECQTAGVPLFIKQLGADVIDRGCQLRLDDAQHGGDGSQWPSDLRLRQMPVARIAAQQK